MKTDEIRARFLDFFKKRGHKIVRSDSLVPQGDPTLLFTSAGMNQFKDYFLGLKKDLLRAASSQKCLRTGDLDQVGRTAYHHSFFEMLGNFSFGDYFKREAIQWAWEFLTKELGLPSERLRVSVHESDEEAYKIWRDDVGVSEKWISKLGDKTNFWPANAPKEGPNGPSGPCSEIYYDQGEAYSGKPHPCSIEHDCGRFTEIWNLVFTQYDRRDGGRLVPLKSKNIDTGMGLERLACVVQKKRSNFEIDIFEPINAEIQRCLSIEPKPKTLRTDFGSFTYFYSIYAVADHARAVVFSLTDGVIPSNEGRGYVVRKLIRRAIWRAYVLTSAFGQKLKGSFLYQLVPTIASVMEAAYPEINEVIQSVSTTLRGEEERFLSTLETGLERLQSYLGSIKGEKEVLPGEVVFELYDTYGFPDELTKKISKDQGFQIDEEGFNRLMKEQRQRAKGASALGESIFVTSEFDRKLHELAPTKFLGYETHQAKAKVLMAQVEGERGMIILDRTPFYAESGGQVGDQGILEAPQFEARVEDTQKKDGYHLHEIRILRGKVQPGMEIQAKIDVARREGAMRNHTATHLLHAVLREVLGKQVRQVGSLVHPDRLRFDYSLARPLTEEELLKIESRVNEEILKDTPLQKEEKDFEQAKGEGALAFFGEKYGDRVRIVTVPGISKEFCGGTHCHRTGEIGMFVVTGDTSIASGVRRMEALTGAGALRYFQRLRSELERAGKKLRAHPFEVAERIEKFQERAKKMERESREEAVPSADPKVLIEKREKVGAYTLILERFNTSRREELWRLSDRLRSQTRETVWFLICRREDKPHFVVGLSPDLKNSSLDARELAQEAARLLKGSGGGRKDFAEGGGNDLQVLEKNWEAVVQSVKAYLERKG